MEKKFIAKDTFRGMVFAARSDGAWSGEWVSPEGLASLNNESDFVPSTPEENAAMLAQMDADADAKFAEEHGIGIDEIPSYIARIRGES